MTNAQQVLRSAFQYWVKMPTRWMDNDVYGHVNNVTYYSYFDTAVNSFLITEGGLDFQGSDQVGFVVASSCQFKQPVAFPHRLEIGLKVNHLGHSSVEYGLAVFIEGDNSASAFGSFTHVFVSRRSGSAVPIPVRVREALENLAAGGD